MSKRDIIYIPEDAGDIPITYFPTSNNLHNFLRRSQVKLVSDLKKLSQETIEEILYNKKKPFSELKQLIIAIQESDLEEIILIEGENSVEIEIKIGDSSNEDEIEESFDETQPLKTLNDLLEFVNDFAEELQGIDEAVFLGRLGATPDEKVVPMAKICGECKLSPDFVGQTMTAYTNEINTAIGYEGYNILSKLRNDCYDNICLLTPEFLIHLTDYEYTLFIHPPAFYIRLIGLLSPRVPILPEFENKTKYLGKDVAKISRQIGSLLRDFAMPLPFTEVFEHLAALNFKEKNLLERFFEAVKSLRFNIIRGDKPNELYIELKR